MSKPSAKKFRKAKKRQQKVQQKKVSDQKLAKYFSLYPSIELDDGKDEFVDSEFLKKIQSITKTIKFNNDNLFPKWQQQFFKLLKKYKVNAIGKDGRASVTHLFELLSKATNNTIQPDIARNKLFNNLGTIIFKELIKRDFNFEILPYQNFFFFPVNDYTVVTFNPLHFKKSSHGNIFFSKRRSEVIINGQKKIVGFSKHSIDRIKERTIYSNTTYEGANGLYNLITDKAYYEVVLVSGQIHLTLYDPGMGEYDDVQGWINPVHNIARYILGEKYDINQEYHYRVGYLPMVLTEEFAKGKTLLLPGMKGTPEHALLLKSKNHRSRESEIDSAVKKIPGILEQIKSKPHLEALRWFHDNGIPQVITTNQQMSHAEIKVNNYNDNLVVLPF